MQTCAVATGAGAWITGPRPRIWAWRKSAGSLRGATRRQLMAQNVGAYGSRVGIP